MTGPRRLRVGRHHGVSIVEHEGDADRGVMVAAITAAPGRSFEDALRLAEEICAAVNTARDVADVRLRGQLHQAGWPPPGVQVHIHPDPPAVAEAIRDIRRYGLPPVRRPGGRL